MKEAYRLWRERNSDWPKIYPSISEWVFAPAVSEEALLEALEFDLVRGLDDQGEYQTIYFINLKRHTRHYRILLHFAEARDYSPKFKCPSWELSAQYMRNGLNSYKAFLASAMYRAETEAVIYELSTFRNSTLTNERFLKSSTSEVLKLKKGIWRTSFTAPVLMSSTTSTQASSSMQRRPTSSAPSTLASSIQNKDMRELTKDEIAAFIEENPEEGEFQEMIDLFAKFPEDYRKRMAAQLGFGEVPKKIRIPKFEIVVPPTIQEASQEDPDVSTQTIRSIRRSIIASARTLTSQPVAAETYASTAHFRVGNLRNIILGEGASSYQQPQDSFIDNGPQHSSTPRRQPTALEQAIPLSPPGSDISVNSRTFRVPSSPASDRSSRDLPPHQKDTRSQAQPSRTFRMTATQEPEPTSRRNGPPRGGPPDDDDDDTDTDSQRGNGRGGGPPRGPGRYPAGPPPPGGPPGTQGVDPLARPPRAFAMAPYHFDPKLKMDDIPTWDGDPDTLMKWIQRVQEISDMGDHCFNQLGLLAPNKFKYRADNWFRALSPAYKRQIQANWTTLRIALATHFLNHHHWT